MVYLVTYNLHSSDAFFLIERTLRNYNFVKLNDFTYLVNTLESVDEFHTHLADGMYHRDGVYVSAVSKPIVWKGFPTNVSDWIIENLGKKNNVN